MRIAVSTANFKKVSGHAGRARKWLIFDTETVGKVERLDLPAKQVIHYHEDGSDHPLDEVDVIITCFAGEGFIKRMKEKGVDVGLTSEADPAKAVADYRAGTLAPPKPRPMGELLCKAMEMLSKNH